MANVTRDSIYLKIASLSSANLLYVGEESYERFGSLEEINAKIADFELMVSQLNYIQENLDSVVTFTILNNAIYNEIRYSAIDGIVVVSFSFKYKWHARDNDTAWEHINEWLSEQATILDEIAAYWSTESVPDTDIFDLV